MKRFLYLILTVCLTVLLFSCVNPANEGVLIIPSSANPSSPVVTESVPETVAEPLLAETEAPDVTSDAGDTAAEEPFDALIMAQKLLGDEDFLALLAQYELTSADEKTAIVAALLAYQREQGMVTLPDEMENADDTVVYWTAGGSVWHVTDDCSALSKSKSIVSGVAAEAIKAGKTRVCKRCGT